MIRLKPTLLSVSIGEIQDYEKRRQQNALKGLLRETLLEPLHPKAPARQEELPAEASIADTFATMSSSPLRSQACSPALLVERIDNLHLQTRSPIKSPVQFLASPVWPNMDGHAYDGVGEDISPVVEEPPHSIGRRLRHLEIPASDLETTPRARYAVASGSQARYSDSTPKTAHRATPNYSRDLSRRPGTPFRSPRLPMSFESESNYSNASTTQARPDSSSQRSRSADSIDRTPSRPPPSEYPGNLGSGATLQRSSSLSAKTMPRVADEAESELMAASSSTGFHIYNDELPPEQQPQTPMNLPESRHRSRLMAAFTAPVPRGRAQTVMDIPMATATVTAAPRRDRSPVGMVDPGFFGLYGGMENGDDVTLFEEGERRRQRGLDE